MKKHEREKAFKVLEEKLNCCPHCGEKVRVFRLHDSSVVVHCSCYAQVVGKIQDITLHSNEMAWAWNDYCLHTQWSNEALLKLAWTEKRILTVDYETGKIVDTSRDMEEAYWRTAMKQIWSENFNKTFGFFAMEEGKLSSIALSEFKSDLM